MNCFSLYLFDIYLFRSLNFTLKNYKYDGSYNDQNQRHGEGKAIFANGDMYEGAYENGKRNGHGIYKWELLIKNWKIFKH